jgi:hypothetical protein
LTCSLLPFLIRILWSGWVLFNLFLLVVIKLMVMTLLGYATMPSTGAASS